MLRRLAPADVQPDSFEFTPANLEWARAQMTKYPEGRQQSAVIPILWRAQEQEGWLTRRAIEYVANLLGMADIRVLEVATFYFMFQLHPVGTVLHIQICGTTTCMICGAEDLIRVCREKIAPHAHELSADGRFSWEEVECLGACTNAPMVQIGKDFYEDLTAEKLAALIDAFAAGEVPLPGPQNGRFSSEALGGATSLADLSGTGARYNASAQIAADLRDTIKRIDGTEVPILTKWLTGAAQDETPPDETTREERTKAKAASDRAAEKGADVAAEADKDRVEGLGDAEREGETADPGVEVAEAAEFAAEPAPGRKPIGLEGPRGGAADDLKVIAGIGPKLEELLHSLGVWHFDQIAAWGSEELAWIDDNLEGFHGRASRDKWVDQARSLATSGTTGEKDDTIG